MGLDMYLMHKVHISNYEHDPEGRGLAKSILLALKLENHERFDQSSLEVTLPAGYWRKASAIHAWFVKNVQDGVDECQESYVGKDHLAILKALCEQVIIDPSRAEELLPTQSGFFFGGVDYDEYYFDRLHHTIKIIDGALALADELPGSLSYQSSW